MTSLSMNPGNGTTVVSLPVSRLPLPSSRRLSTGRFGAPIARDLDALTGRDQDRQLNSPDPLHATGGFPSNGVQTRIPPPRSWSHEEAPDPRGNGVHEWVPAVGAVVVAAAVVFPVSRPAAWAALWRFCNSRRRILPVGFRGSSSTT